MPDNKCRLSGRRNEVKNQSGRDKLKYVLTAKHIIKCKNYSNLLVKLSYLNFKLSNFVVWKYFDWVSTIEITSS